MVRRGRRRLSGQRWGILGGTLRPAALRPPRHRRADARVPRPRRRAVHAGRAAAAQAGSLIGAPVHRRSMVELAINGNPALLAADHRAGSRRTVVLGRLARSTDPLELPADRFVFIVSVEAARQLPSWREPERLLELAEIAVVPRLGYPPLEPDWAATRLSRLPKTGSSPSTRRRSAIRPPTYGRGWQTAGPSVTSCRGAVEDYIGRYRLYR